MSEADELKYQANHILQQMSDAQRLLEQAKSLIDESVGGIVTMSVFQPAGLRGAIIMATQARTQIDHAQFDIANGREELAQYRDRL